MNDFLIVVFVMSQIFATVGAAIMFTMALHRREYSILTVVVCVYGIIGTVLMTLVFSLTALSIKIEESRFWEFITKPRNIK
ncbi:hypothetical protein VPHD480_0143 [Vibrio phage D480]|nr:hypothetical protein MYOV011v1_p0067 [Vibrio phage 6E35.1a]